ncbi:glycosyltransferase [Caldibacillus lycopersici]|uniref:Glycosyltransferase n=1 Tax=Perspicuibacillus lycopersici TaxID=1325689 RepID=A0AAE3LNC7_9BACI|nr:glycosyltransferase [Perspicuibacillus lycopersici]MCU9614560.1 glycosyltransferase [Perspicuibacillus lycopersici]
MNILFVYYLPSGGVETLNRQRSIALKKYGIHCDFLYYQKKRELINIHEGRTFVTDNNEEIAKIIQNGNYTAIVLTSDYIGLSRFRKIGYTGLLIYEIQGLGTEKTAQRELKKASYLISKFADAILVSKTPHILAILQALPNLPQTFVMNNCFDIEHFSYLPSQSQIGQPIIAWIGRIENNKNWSEFLHIGHQLIEKYNPNIQLMIFEDPTLSSPDERQKFQQTIQTLNLTRNLIIHSNIPHERMATFYSMIGDSGGLLCSTSITEGFGYAIVEAMSCLCPVLSTRSDGVSNSIIHNQTGKYYTIGNITEAFNEGKELMENKTLREQIRYAALHHVKQEFSIETYGSQFLYMINRLKQAKNKKV